MTYIVYIHPKHVAYSACFRFEAVLQGLDLPYRVLKICEGDLGFTAAFKHYIEVIK
ncbi:hypothetical protein [Clostridium mobile]|uniref:hypothetical protein n=1 Tax=Clostridium mobile TaxID=2841512 RepID=UPI003CCEE328